MFIRFCAAVGTAVLGTLAVQAAAGQTRASYVPALTADGQPDIQGVWQHRRALAGSLECAYDINGTTGNHENFNPPLDDKPRAARQKRVTLSISNSTDLPWSLKCSATVMAA